MRNPIKLAGGAFLCVTLAVALLSGFSALNRTDNPQSVSNVQAQTGFGTIVNLALTDDPMTDVQAVSSTPVFGDVTLLANNTPIDADTAFQASNVQDIEAIVGVFYYPEITVEVNNPVRINFKVSEADLNSCNDEIFMPEWNIKKNLLLAIILLSLPLQKQEHSSITAGWT